MLLQKIALSLKFPASRAKEDGRAGGREAERERGEANGCVASTRMGGEQRGKRSESYRSAKPLS